MITPIKILRTSLPRYLAIIFPTKTPNGIAHCHGKPPFELSLEGFFIAICSGSQASDRYIQVAAPNNIPTARLG
jgi:hypothetical protein